MNDMLKDFAKASLLEGLKKLPDGWVGKFKLMYGRKNGIRSVEDTKAMSIEDVVDEIPDKNLDWAMQQITNSVEKLEKKSDS